MKDEMLFKKSSSFIQGMDEERKWEAFKSQLLTQLTQASYLAGKMIKSSFLLSTIFVNTDTNKLATVSCLDKQMCLYSFPVVP